MLQQLIVVVIQQQLQVNLFRAEVEKLNVSPEAKREQRAPPGSSHVMDNQLRTVSKVVL